MARSGYEIESAMLYKFAKFVAWPAGALGDNGAPLVVGVVGNDAFFSVLKATLRGKSAYGHPIVLRRLDSRADPKGCQVLYVGVSDRAEAAEILEVAGREPVLTVGDGLQFSRQGGVIAFIRDGGHIGFEINLDAAERAGLEISSKLLRLAIIWRETGMEAEN